MEVYNKKNEMKKVIINKDDLAKNVREGGRVDLLDLLDKHTYLPKKKDGEGERRCVTLLDVMDPPTKKVEEPPKKSMDLIEFLDKRTYLPKKKDERGERRCITLLDVMDPPSQSKNDNPRRREVKKNIDLLSLLDEKTRLPRDHVHKERRDIDRLTVHRARRNWAKI
jgi:hypothetical protein